jgi:prepilin-type N-terminal cleavage/methylation domain-containing protein
MKVAGFTLLEVIIAMAIASIVSIILFSATTQLRRGIVGVQDRIIRDERVLLIQKQFSQDLSGVFVPRVATKESNEKKKEKTPTKEEEAATAPDKQPAAAPTQQLVPLEKAFVVKHAEKNLSMMTFITTNPLPSYGSAQERLVRVVYTVEAEPGRKDAYRLMRQELASLDPSDLNKKSSATNYPMIEGIKELTIELVARIAQQQKEGEKKETTKEITVKEWPSKEVEDNSKLLIPDFVVAQVTIWDINYQRFYTTTYRLPIFVKDEKTAPQRSAAPAKPATPSPSKSLATPGGT